MREEENKRTSPKSKVKQFFKKRWAFPAVYIASAAIILSGVLWYQNSASDTDDYQYNSADAPGKPINEEAEPVGKEFENFAWPVLDEENYTVQKEFYDNSLSTEKQVDALVFYENQYQPNTGIDLTLKDGSEFEVVAALSGTVTKVIKDDTLLGNTIEIEHEDGVKTVYQSVTDIQVSQGDQVKKGQTLAAAGKSLLNKEAGVHVHFEIRKANVAVNPIDYFNKPLTALAEEDAGTSTSEESSNGTSNEEAPIIDDATNESETPETDGSSDSDSTDVDEESDASTNPNA